MRVSTINIHPVKTPKVTVLYLRPQPGVSLTVSDDPYPGETTVTLFFDTLKKLQDFRDEFVGALEQFEFEETTR